MADDTQTLAKSENTNDTSQCKSGHLSVEQLPPAQMEAAANAMKPSPTQSSEPTRHSIDPVLFAELTKAFQISRVPNTRKLAHQLSQRKAKKPTLPLQGQPSPSRRVIGLPVLLSTINI